MEFVSVKNNFGDILAVQIVDYDFKTEDPDDIVDLIRKYGIVFWKKANIPVDLYYKWQMKLGYHQPANIWCSHKEYPIFFRVTNKYIQKNQKGLFEDQDLDWHCNILFTPDSEELLGLYAKTAPKGSKTFFANSLPYWKNLNQIKQKEMSCLWIEITNKIEDAYEKKIAHHKLTDYQSEDFEKKRDSRDIRKSLNFDKKHFDLYQEPRFLKKNFLKLVPTHPLGMKGIYFPHLNISSITDKRKTPLSNHHEIYESIKKEYILSGRYTYQHEWENGDIVLSDQLTGVHKRNNIWKSDMFLERELLRSACWYKTNKRKHFEYSI